MGDWRGCCCATCGVHLGFRIVVAPAGLQAGWQRRNFLYACRKWKIRVGVAMRVCRWNPRHFVVQTPAPRAPHPAPGKLGRSQACCTEKVPSRAKASSCNLPVIIVANWDPYEADAYQRFMTETQRFCLVLKRNHDSTTMHRRRSKARSIAHFSSSLLGAKATVTAARRE